MIFETEKMKNKRGQVTIFIIVGIVILVVAGLIIFVTQTDIQIGRRLSTTQVEPIKEYVEDCIQKEIRTDLILMRNNGGYFEFPMTYNYKGLVDKGLVDLKFEGQNRLPILGNIEGGINERVKKALIDDCDLSVFKNYEISAEKGDITVDTKIEPKLINVKVYYPLMIQRGEIKVGLDGFNVQMEDNFGMLHHVANQFIENEQDKLTFEERKLIINIDNSDETDKTLVILGEENKIFGFRY